MSTSYKILYITTRFLGYGASGDLHKIIKDLQHKYHIDLIVGRDDVNFAMLEDFEKVRIFQINSLLRNIHPLKDLKTLFLLYKFVKSGHYDIVHTFTAKSGMLGRFASKLAKTPIIIHGLQGSTFHSLQNTLVKRIFINLERFAGKFTDCFVCVGEDLKRKYLNQNIGMEQNYVIIHTGQDLEAFFQSGNLPADRIAQKKQELGLKSNEIIIGKVARLSPVKGHLYCIEVAEKIISKEPKVKFLFAGDGPYRSTLESEVRKRHLEENVIFAGFRRDIAEVMATFDIMVHTSLLEGLPHVFVQACAVGKPIVTFDIEGAHDMINEGENGFIVPIGDVDALVEKLYFLISNLDKAKEMGLKGKEKIDDSWMVESMIKNTDKLYQMLLKAREKRKQIE